MLIWCLKQVTDFIFKFSINESFFGVHKIIKFTIYNTDFYLKWRYL